MELFSIVIVVVLLIIIPLAYFTGARSGYSRIWDIPKNGKPYQIVAIRKASHCYFELGFSDDKESYAIVLNSKEGRPRLVKLAGGIFSDSHLVDYLEVGRYIYKTPAGYKVGY